MFTINPKNFQHNKFTLKYSCQFFSCLSAYYMGSTEKVSNEHFYIFQKLPQELLLKWESVCELSPDMNCATYFVCENHFFEEDFMNKTRQWLNRGVFRKHVAIVSSEVASISSKSGETVVNCELGLRSTSGSMASAHYAAANTISETGVNELQSFSGAVASSFHAAVSTRSGSGETSVNSELGLPSISGAMEYLYYRDANTRNETGVSELPSTSCAEESNSLSDASLKFFISPQNVSADGEYTFLSETFCSEESGVLGTQVSESDLTPRKSKM
ncbi:uncharacterized protein LOC126297990 [Schistocerca gregaria]|uniref:uncharacterized protein LOC126297990 n=1 Tax=Schistocerca gregaria TaxID=7010 RepID=UPI00211DA61E|nr:uncharacterized protein LOC126297990 [Schistocerca gregaria]